MGQATTTGDEGGDKYGTQRPTSEADEDWRLERRASDESDGSNTDSSSTTNSSSGGTSSKAAEVEDYVRCTSRCIRRYAMAGGLGPTQCKRCLEEMEIEVKVLDGCYR